MVSLILSSFVFVLCNHIRELERMPSEELIKHLFTKSLMHPTLDYYYKAPHYKRVKLNHQRIRCTDITVC